MCMDMMYVFFVPCASPVKIVVLGPGRKGWDKKRGFPFLIWYLDITFFLAENNMCSWMNKYRFPSVYGVILVYYAMR